MRLKGDLILVIRYPHKEKRIDTLWICRIAAKGFTKYNNRKYKLEKIKQKI